MRKPKTKRPYRDNCVMWARPTIFPAWVGFCPSEKAWKQFLKEYAIDDTSYPVADGNTTSFEREGKKAHLLILITLNKRHDTNPDGLGVIALLMHEVMHAFQCVLADAGETRPGKETEAYLFQVLSGDIMHSYQRTRRPRCLRGM